jgi:hypothetical protein
MTEHKIYITKQNRTHTHMHACIPLRLCLELVNDDVALRLLLLRIGELTQQLLATQHQEGAHVHVLGVGVSVLLMHVTLTMSTTTATAALLATLAGRHWLQRLRGGAVVVVVIRLRLQTGAPAAMAVRVRVTAVAVAVTRAAGAPSRRDPPRRLGRHAGPGGGGALRRRGVVFVHSKDPFL